MNQTPPAPPAIAFLLNDLSLEFEDHDRRSTLGASEIAGVLGAHISKWDSPLRIWAQKRGIDLGEEEASPPMIRGQIGESMILDEYARQNPDLVVIPTGRRTFIDPAAPWRSASPDAFAFDPALGSVRLVEAKWPGRWTLNEWDGGPPDRYALQALWQLSVIRSLFRANEGAVDGPVPLPIEVDLFLPWDLEGWEFRLETVQFDPVLVADVEAVALEFWTHNVIDGNEPDWDGSDAAGEYLRVKWPAKSEGRAKGDLVDGRDSEEIQELFRTLFRLEREAERATAGADAARQAIKDAIGPHYGITPGGIAKKAIHYDCKGRSSTNWKGIVADMGYEVPDEIMARHTKKGAPYRSFRVTWAADAEDQAR